MRSRNIKPGFFLNEDLADIEAPWGRLCFAGLWCMADREGRLEDRPRRIKAEVFPYDQKMPNIEKIIEALGKNNFILRYEVNGDKFIQINKFKEHQRPHGTERLSLIPAPLINGELTVDSPLDNGGNCPDSLIPDSLIPDSLIPDSLEKRKKATPLPPKIKTSISENFTISAGVQDWAAKKGFDRLEDHLEAFILRCRAKNYRNVDWDAAFKTAIREDWGKIRAGGGLPAVRASPGAKPLSKAEAVTEANLAARKEALS